MQDTRSLFLGSAVSRKTSLICLILSLSFGIVVVLLLSDSRETKLPYLARMASHSIRTITEQYLAVVVGEKQRNE